MGFSKMICNRSDLVNKINPDFAAMMDKIIQSACVENMTKESKKVIEMIHEESVREANESVKCSQNEKDLMPVYLGLYSSALSSIYLNLFANGLVQLYKIGGVPLVKNFLGNAIPGLEELVVHIAANNQIEPMF